MDCPTTMVFVEYENHWYIIKNNFSMRLNLFSQEEMATAYTKKRNFGRRATQVHEKGIFAYEVLKLSICKNKN